MTIFKQLFCNYEYSVVGTVNCTCDVREEGVLQYTKKVPIDFLECVKCGKRRVLMWDSKNYSKSMLGSIKLWNKHQIEIDFNKD